MAENDWRLQFPGDFSSQEEYEAAGWIKTERFDLCYVDGNYFRCAIGAAKPLEKYSAQTYYENEELGLTAVALNYLNQGVTKVMWWKTNNYFLTAPLIGEALYINGQWVIKQLNEYSEWAHIEWKTVGSSAIIKGFSIRFFGFKSGKKEITATLTLTRDKEDFR